MMMKMMVMVVMMMNQRQPLVVVSWGAQGPPLALRGQKGGRSHAPAAI